MEDLYTVIRKNFGWMPSPEQATAIEVFRQFLNDQSDRPVMLMKGAAGTGKTSLAGAFVRTLVALRQKVMLLAPTGRAAKVFSLNSGQPAFTIHRKIFRQKTFTGTMTGFHLHDNLSHDMVFFVDEASMISNSAYG